MTLSEARRLLRVEPGADPAALARAFREAAKLVHPDRTGGDSAPFREVVEAHERLKRAPATSARRDDGVKVRGGDLWMTAYVSPRILRDGGRLMLDTPHGKRVVWVTKRAGQMGLMRLPGEGLFAAPGRPQGHLFVTLVEREPSESGARALLRRFAAAWAA